MEGTDKTLIYVPSEEEKKRLKIGIDNAIRDICGVAKTRAEVIYCLILMKESYEDIEGIKINGYNTFEQDKISKEKVREAINESMRMLVDDECCVCALKRFEKNLKDELGL